MMPSFLLRSGTRWKRSFKKAQELAKQNADLALAQRSTLETQLKQAQDKLQQAQQNADLASSQRAALETQLKQDAGQAPAGAAER